MMESVKNKTTAKGTQENRDNGTNQHYDLNDFNGILQLIANENDEEIKRRVTDHIKEIIPESISNNYEVLFLCRAIGAIDDFDSDSIYSRLPNNKEKNILLLINSIGGRIEPAYLISKSCKEHTKEKFVVSIPRRAKSAATLIALGADEIHMGSLSEIGPIDPQFNGLPALGLSSALECLARLCKKYPETSNMFAEYLSKTLPINILGYFERISESAEHYAIRLLKNKNLVPAKETEIAHKLVYEYKDHSFVIDKDETKTLFGGEVVKIDTDEYKLGNNIYSFLEKINFVLRWQKNKMLNLIGSVGDIYFNPLK